MAVAAAQGYALHISDSAKESTIDMTTQFAQLDVQTLTAGRGGGAPHRSTVTHSQHSAYSLMGLYRSPNGELSAIPKEKPVITRPLCAARPAASSFLVASLVAIASAALAPTALAAPTLTGRAVLPAQTFAPGPLSGALLGTDPINGVTVPFQSQPVQGFSGALDRGDGSFDVMEDNGYGAKANSADFNLRVYRVRPNFHTASGGDGGVALEALVELSDPKRRAGFPITNDTVLGRTLTGADFDIESVQRANDGSLWIGDEFGPFVLHFSADGELLDAPFATPGVQSDSNPFIPADTGNLPNSKGFEGMAISPDGRYLYPMLEGALKTDPDPQLTLRIFEFDTQAKAFTGRLWKYRLEASGNALGDLQVINEHELLIIERDGGQGPAAALKMIYKIDLARIDAEGFVAKDEVVNLLTIADPAGLSTSVPAPRPDDFGLGDPFLFPFVTIEDVVVLSTSELLVINDNNFPFSTGRNPGLPDDNEFIRIELDSPLNVDAKLLLRAPVLTAREALLAGVQRALADTLEDARQDAKNALALLERAKSIIDTLDVQERGRCQRRIIGAAQLIDHAIDALEKGRAQRGAKALILARELLRHALSVKHPKR